MMLLQERIYHWLRNREEQPTLADLCAAFPDNQRTALERAMAKLVRDGWAIVDGPRWTTSEALDK